MERIIISILKMGKPSKWQEKSLLSRFCNSQVAASHHISNQILAVLTEVCPDHPTSDCNLSLPPSFLTLVYFFFSFLVTLVIILLYNFHYIIYLIMTIVYCQSFQILLPLLLSRAKARISVFVW